MLWKDFGAIICEANPEDSATQENQPQGQGQGCPAAEAPQNAVRHPTQPRVMGLRTVPLSCVRHPMVYTLYIHNFEKIYLYIYICILCSYIYMSLIIHVYRGPQRSVSFSISGLQGDLLSFEALAPRLCIPEQRANSALESPCGFWLPAGAASGSRWGKEQMTADMPRIGGVIMCPIHVFYNKFKGCNINYVFICIL